MFDTSAWKKHKVITVLESAGLAREKETVDTAFALEDAGNLDAARELRIACRNGKGAEEVVSQFYALKQEGAKLTGRVAFLATLPAGSRAEYRLYYGNPSAEAPSYPTGLTHRKADKGPQHRFIENAYYKVETLPTSGQIWHMWNKLGTNTSWHHFEWNVNKEKQGDPCHWAPNCWVAYPERITNGYELLDGEDCDFIDWQYVFGWDDPECEVIEGPVFLEIKRRGIVWPHPEHSSPKIKRDKIPRVFAEVTYRFYAESPHIYQSSRLETLEDMNVFFIRNCQFVFFDFVFTHMIIAPEPGGLLPHDEAEPAVVQLMGKINNKPYDWIEHSLSNILPGKLAWYSYYHDENHDGFAVLQTAERNTNIYSGKSVLQNHRSLLTEVKDWSLYTCRSMSYTNQRFNPENVTFLPKGERYDEENYLLVYRHDGLEGSLSQLGGADARLKNPLSVSVS
jgi:hypothetical protein